jgi:hypothetical protein
MSQTAVTTPAPAANVPTAPAPMKPPVEVAVKPKRRRAKPGSRVILEQLGEFIGSPQLVTLVEISDEGLAFEFKKFVYTATPCSLVLKTPTNTFMRIRGQVRDTECYEAGTFWVNIRFEASIDIDAVMSGSPSPSNPQ